MSFFGWKKYIEEGDLVIVYMVKERNNPRYISNKTKYHQK
jgi:hypothetical protein